MRFFHRLLSLSLCGMLLLGMPGPVWALSPTPRRESAVAAVNPVSDPESKPDAVANQAPDPEAKPDGAVNQAPDPEAKSDAAVNQVPDLEAKPDAAVNPVSDLEPKPDAAVNQVPDSEPKPVCYLPLKPVTDVYLPYGGGFDDFKAAMGGLVQDLYPNGDSYAEPMPFTYRGNDTNGDEFTKLLQDAIRQKKTEFRYPIIYAIDRELWESEPEKLSQWDQGLIKAPKNYDVTVHLRPADLQVTYHPDPQSSVPELWVDQSDPFDWLYLPDSDSPVQTENPYDPSHMEFAITWDEQSYKDGISSGANSFYITGAYTDLYYFASGDPEYDLYEKGLMKAEGQPKALIHVKPLYYPFYYNPYFKKNNRYENGYQFQINIAPGTHFDCAHLPSKADLDPFQGDPQDTLTFGVQWNRKEYEDGLASGADSFTVSGAYGPNPEWSPQLQDRWEKGEIKILSGDASETPSLKAQEQRKNEDRKMPVSDAPETPSLKAQEQRENGETEMPASDASETPSLKAQEQRENEDREMPASDVPETPPPELTVNVRKDGLPFTVKMEYRMQEGQGNEGLVPVFTFPWPNGATKVTTAVSLDRNTWYQEDVMWSDEYEWSDAEWHFVHLDENGKLIAIPLDDPVPFYCKLIVTDSPFAGETQLMKVSPDGDGAWEMAPDQGGDHGGGGQGEHDRPGRDDPDVKPEPDQDLKPSSGQDGDSRPSSGSDWKPGKPQTSSSAPDPGSGKPQTSPSVPAPEPDQTQIPPSASALEPGQTQTPSSPSVPNSGKSQTLSSGSAPGGAAGLSSGSGKKILPQMLSSSDREGQESDLSHPEKKGDVKSPLENDGVTGDDGENPAWPPSNLQTASVPRNESDQQWDGQSDPDSHETSNSNSPNLYLPGFVWAWAATAAVILAGAFWLRRFKKRK